MGAYLERRARERAEEEARAAASAELAIAAMDEALAPENIESYRWVLEIAKRWGRKQTSTVQDFMLAIMPPERRAELAAAKSIDAAEHIYGEWVNHVSIVAKNAYDERQCGEERARITKHGLGAA